MPNFNKLPKFRLNLDYKPGTLLSLDCACDFPQFGFLKGDKLLVEISYYCEEHQLAAWHIKGKKSSVMAFAFNNFGDVSLDYKNGEIARFKPNDITLVGIVKGYQRQIESFCFSEVGNALE
jgi:hypothetical protein